MKDQLVNALEMIGPHIRDSERLRRVTDVIKGLEIPEQDYGRVSRFIFILLDQFPEITRAFPHDQPLRNLCIYCLNHMALRDEFTPRGSKPS